MKSFRFLQEKEYSCNGLKNIVKEYFHETLQLEFALIPQGVLEVNGQGIQIEPFLMAKHTINQKCWQQVMGKNLSYIRGGNLPVEMISWADCTDFCNKTGLSIPKETEWEYACRSHSTTKFYWGDEMNIEYCWNKMNSNRQTHPSGEKLPNAFGLYDMLGNVNEFCYTQMGVYEVDKDSICVKRGGAWNSYPHNSQCNSRDFDVTPSAKIGLRVCCYETP